MLPFTNKGSTLILIGPEGNLVEDVGEMLASNLNKPFIHLGDLTDKYSKEIGFKSEDEKEAHDRGGFDGFYLYRQPFIAHSIKRVVQKHEGAIIAFTPLQSIDDDSKSLSKVIEYLRPFDVV